MDTNNIIIVGAGLGGIATAARLNLHFTSMPLPAPILPSPLTMAMG